MSKGGRICECAFTRATLPLVEMRKLKKSCKQFYFIPRQVFKHCRAKRTYNTEALRFERWVRKIQNPKGIISSNSQQQAQRHSNSWSATNKSHKSRSCKIKIKFKGNKKKTQTKQNFIQSQNQTCLKKNSLKSALRCGRCDYSASQ